MVEHVLSATVKTVTVYKLNDALAVTVNVSSIAHERANPHIGSYLVADIGVRQGAELLREEEISEEEEEASWRLTPTKVVV